MSTCSSAGSISSNRMFVSCVGLAPSMTEMVCVAPSCLLGRAERRQRSLERARIPPSVCNGEGGFPHPCTPQDTATRQQQARSQTKFL